MEDPKKKEDHISGFKAFFKKMAEKIDKKIEEKAKSGSCCCNPKDQKGNSCCK